MQNVQCFTKEQAKILQFLQMGSVWCKSEDAPRKLKWRPFSMILDATSTFWTSRNAMEASICNLTRSF
jgi:hypothetical protein